MKIKEAIVYGVKRWGLFVSIVSASVIMLLIIHKQVYAYYLNQPRYQLNLQMPLEVRHKPDWCPDPYFQESIKNSMQLAGRTSLFDRNIVGKVLAQYQKNPWVAKVSSIEKKFPNKLVVKVEMRKPVAMVEIKKWNNRSFYYLVDKDSVRLPGEYYNLPVVTLPITLPVIVGVRNSPPQAGQKWQDQGLYDALALASTLKKYQVAKKVEIAAIDVNNIDGRVKRDESEIVLISKNKVQIEWGRPINTTKPFEMSAEDKIRNLYRVLDISPQLAGVKNVKVQFDQPYIVLFGAPATPSARRVR